MRFLFGSAWRFGALDLLYLEDDLGSVLAGHNDVQQFVAVHVGNPNLQAGADAPGDKVSSELFLRRIPVVVIDGGLFVGTGILSRVCPYSLASDDLLLPIAVDVGQRKRMSL